MSVCVLALLIAVKKQKKKIRLSLIYENCSIEKIFDQ